MQSQSPKDERPVNPSAEALRPGSTSPWHRHFPIRQSEEHAVSRRQFAAFCGCSAAALAAGIPLQRKLSAPPPPSQPVAVCGLDEIAPGTAIHFDYPTPDHPCILIRLSADQFVACSAACTHLMCPVHFEPGTSRLVCPCHKGFFDARDGSVIAGPPRRPLPRYEVNISAGTVFVGPGWIPNEMSETA